MSQMNPQPSSLKPNRTMIVAKDGSGDFETLGSAVSAIGASTKWPASGSNNRYIIIVRQAQDGGTTTIVEPTTITLTPYVSVRGEGNTSIEFVADADGIVLASNCSLDNIRVRRAAPSSAGKEGFKIPAGASHCTLNNCAYYNFSLGWGNHSTGAGIRIINCYTRQGTTDFVYKSLIAGSFVTIIGMQVYDSVTVNDSVIYDAVGGEVCVFSSEFEASGINRGVYSGHADTLINLIGVEIEDTVNAGVEADQGEVLCEPTRLDGCDKSIVARLGSVRGNVYVEDSGTLDYETTNASAVIDLHTASPIDYSKISQTAGSVLRVNQTEWSNRFTSTGLIGAAGGDPPGGVITVNGVNADRFDVSDGAGVIVDNYTDPLNPSLTRVDWSGLTNVALTDITQEITYIGVDSLGQIYQKNTEFTATEKRDYIYLGYVGHPSHATIDYIVSTPNVAYEPGIQFETFLEALGPFNVYGNEYGANGANLKVDRAAGGTYKLGSGYTDDRKTPNYKVTDAETEVDIIKVYRNAGGTFVADAPATTVDPANYDPGGGAGKTAVPLATDFTIQYMFFYPDLPDDNCIVQYGQAVYASMALAEAAVQQPFAVATDIVKPCTFRGWLIVRSDCNDLTDAAKAKFIPAGKFWASGGGGGGGGGGTITDGQNVGAGVHVFYQALGNLLEFYTIQDAGDNKVVVTQNLLSQTVDLDVDENNLDHTLLQNVGTNTHNQIDSFISSKGAANGIAPLNGASKVPDANSQVPSTHPAATTGVHGVGVSTVASAQDIADHAAVTSSVHNFDASGNAPPQAHAIGGAVHTGSITDVQHGARGAGLHADSHAQLHSILSGSDHTTGGGAALSILRVNAAGTGLEWTAPSGAVLQTINTVGTGNASQASAAGYNPTTGGTGTRMIVNITTTAGTKLVCLFSAGVQNSANNQNVYFKAQVDGADMTPQRWVGTRYGTAGVMDSNMSFVVTGLAAGPHTVEILWRTTGGSVSMTPATEGNRMGLIVQEVTV